MDIMTTLLTLLHRIPVRMCASLFVTVILINVIFYDSGEHQADLSSEDDLDRGRLGRLCFL
jgi:hypothetical protein